MSRATRVLIASAMIGTSLTMACSTDSDTPSPTGPEQSEAPASQLVRRQDSVDIPVRKRFTVGVDATGDFKPNTPLTITVTVAGVAKSTPNAEVALYFPELQAYNANRTTYKGIPIGMRATAAHRWNQDVARAASATRSTVVTFPEPGLYTLQVVARRPSPDPDQDWTNRSETVNAWISISPEGGRLSLEYDPTPDSRGRDGDRPVGHDPIASHAVLL